MAGSAGFFCLGGFLGGNGLVEVENICFADGKVSCEDDVFFVVDNLDAHFVARIGSCSV